MFSVVSGRLELFTYEQRCNVHFDQLCRDFLGGVVHVMDGCVMVSWTEGWSVQVSMCL